VKYSQSNRPLQVDTPLPSDTLLITGFRATEELSALFSFQLNLIAENSAAIDFTKLIGNDMTVSLATLGEAGATDWRYINSGYPARLI
jgi:type VI secretion system secreted protein VgrG